MVSQINKENQWLLLYLTIYNVAVSISHTANVHVGEDDAAAFRTIFFMSDTTGVYPSWNENFQFSRTEGPNRFLNRRRIPTCEVRYGNPIDLPMLRWKPEEKPRLRYNRPQSWCVCDFPPYKICRARKTDRASFPDRFHIDNATPQRWVSSFSYIPSLV